VSKLVITVNTLYVILRTSLSVKSSVPVLMMSVHCIVYRMVCGTTWLRLMS